MKRSRTEQWRSQFGEDLEPLLTGCVEGDSRSWHRLLDDVRQLAMDTARRTYHLSREDAEDLAQLVQIRVAERLPQLRRRAAFPLWVRRIIHHLAIDMLRRHPPLLSLDDPSQVTLDAHAHEVTAHHYEQALLKADLERALSRLPIRYREPIRLHLLDGMPQEDIGRLLGRPRSTVATQIERGLERLRRTLSGMLAVSG